MPAPELHDLPAAHRHFAAACFNEAWTLLEQSDRTARDDERMVALSMASIYHWTERPDVDDRSLSIGYWQAARIRTVLGHVAEARRLAQLCLSYSAELQPFYLGFAHEAAARAAGLDGDAAARARHLEIAQRLLDGVADADDRAMLEADLQTV